MKQPRPGDLSSNQNIPPTRIPTISELDMVTLPRDVLKWIQSLDLTYSIKNVKKDFNNGFLVAQIISRYYPKVVQMHSIDNGFSNERKRDNWILIGKYLKDMNEPNLKNENIEVYIKNENNEILFFILKLYQELAKRKVPLMDGKKFKTDQDDINRSYLLKETGEIELLKKDAENTEKRSEEIQKSLKTNTTVLSQYKTNNVIMKGDLKPISNNIFDISEKKFNPKISEAKVFERSTKILRQSKDVMLTNDINSKSPLLNKNNTANTNAESQNAGTRIALSELISMQEKKDEDKSSKVKNPFEWFEESIQKKLQENHKYVMSRFKIENNLFYDFFKNINVVSTEALALVMSDINKMIDEYYNFLSEQVNEYVSIFLLIFECYVSIELDDDKFQVMHDAIIVFFIKSLKNRSEEMIYIFKNILIKKIFEAMNNLENREKLIYLCEIIYKIMDPTDAQQVEFFKMFKDYLSANEEILYECFSILHDLIPNYSEALMDICLFYILSGISHISADIRYHSLYILHRYILLNVNFFYNFEPKLKKLSLSEKDRENNLIIIKTSLLFLKHNYQNKLKPKDPAVKKTTFLGFENRFDEDTANANYFNELTLGNEIIRNILRRYVGDSLFMLIACSTMAEYLNDNIDLNKIFLSALFQANEVIFNYIFYPGSELTDNIIKLQQYTKFRVKPEYQKFREWHYHYLCQALNSLIEEREKSEQTSRPLSEKEYRFIQFTIAPGFNPLQSEIWKSSFKFSKLLLLDCYDKSKSERALKVLEAFLFFEPIQKQVLEDIYDHLQEMITRLLENREDPVNKRVLETLNHTLRSWSQHPNSSSILRDGLRKLIDLFIANSNNTNGNSNKNNSNNANNMNSTNNHLNINFGASNANNTNTNNNNSFVGAGGVNSNVSQNNFNSVNNNSINVGNNNNNNNNNNTNKGDNHLNFNNASNFGNNSQMNANNSFNGTNIMASNNTSIL